MSVFVVVSEEFTHRNQSWEFTGVYRNNSGQFQVHIRDNAYEDQSYAKVSCWSAEGWQFFLGLPTEAWYRDAPSYTAKSLEPEQADVFFDVALELLTRLAHAKWDSIDLPELDREAMRSRPVTVPT